LKGNGRDLIPVNIPAFVRPRENITHLKHLTVSWPKFEPINSFRSGRFNRSPLFSVTRLLLCLML